MGNTARWWTGRWVRLLVGLAAGAVALVPREAAAQPTASKEYQVKAAFLFNFIQFVEWPQLAFANADTPICVGVLGENPFGMALEEVIRGETIQSRTLVIQHSRRFDTLKHCHLVFISKSETERIGDILAELDAVPVLTVSEVDGFARRGGVINLYLADNKVRFEINPAAARRKGLKISSELLSLGRIVQAEPPGGRR